MSYIATRPVRFDRKYAVGETIPASVIDPRRTKRLVEMGKIQYANTPGAAETDSASGAGEMLAFMEELLGISYEGTPPTVEERKEVCKERLAEIAAAAPAQAKPDEGDPETKDGEVAATETADDGAPPAVEEFPCPECGKTFTSKQALAGHMRTHNK